MPPNREFFGVFLIGDPFHVSGFYSKCFLSPEQHCHISTDHIEPWCITMGEGEQSSLDNRGPGSSAMATNAGSN